MYNEKNPLRLKSDFIKKLELNFSKKAQNITIFPKVIPNQT